MSCKIVKLSNCEIAGTTFENRTLTITGGVISSAKIVVKNTFNKVLKEVEGEVLGNKILFHFNDLEGLPAGTYYIEYWAEIEDIGREVVALEELKVSHAKDSRCDCNSEADIVGNIVFQKKEITVNLTKNIIQKEKPQEEKVVFVKNFQFLKPFIGDVFFVKGFQLPANVRVIGFQLITADGLVTTPIVFKYFDENYKVDEKHRNSIGFSPLYLVSNIEATKELMIRYKEL